MYGYLGKFVARRWYVVILFWVILGAALAPRIQRLAGIHFTPTWDEVTKDGDLAYLPDRVTSVRGQRLYGEAFPDNKSRSEVVIVLERKEGLQPNDLQFAQEVADYFEAEKAKVAELTPADTAEKRKELMNHLAVVEVMRPSATLEGGRSAEDMIGQKLISPDRQAAIVVATLEHELIAIDSARLMWQLAIGDEQNPALLPKMVEQAQSRGLNPVAPGLNWGITGSAAVGGDTLLESDKSIQAIHATTGILVVVILLIVYRAPVLVAVPLLTIAMSVWLANNLIALLTQLNTVPGFGWFEFEIFKTSEIFIFTICFGSGTDFCLFLISRYREELERRHERKAGIAEALSQVGEALTGSAMTTVCGLSMMYFADFGKFTYSGPAIALCLIVTLLGCLTLAPAMLCMFGRLVYWPFKLKLKEEHADDSVDDSWIGRFWTWTSARIMARPGLIMFASLIIMTPLAYAGLDVRVSYDLLSDLPDSERPSSKSGTAMMQRHFPAGEMGPISILAVKDGFDFVSTEGHQQITELTKEFYEKFPNRIDAVRSLTWPLGDKPRQLSLGERLAHNTMLNHKNSEAKYVATSGPWKGQVTRFDIIPAADPFSPEAENLLGSLDPQIRETTLSLEKFVAAKASDPNSFWHGATFDFIGTTAGTRDLKAVITSDERLIQQLVVIAVSAVVLFILRRPLICAYLIFTVVFSYLVTIGATQLVFDWMYADFPGLDWKVPIFLFVILVAVGEDYNIYLATRVFEEERRLGRLPGLRAAVIKTGGIITSCGVIMAGTFVSLMSGSLKAMHALGFALTLGVILDTFIVRPILVPAFLAWLYRFTPERITKVVEPISEELPEDAIVVGAPNMDTITVPAKPHTDMARRSAKRSS